MAWGRPERKSIEPVEQKAYQVGPGAPVSLSPGNTGRPYKDGWSIERAYQEAFQRITWVARCIDVISGNQARLPVILRKGNSEDGEILPWGNNPLMEILNVKANKGENSFSFRKRMSAQLLLSTRGVFIEKVYNSRGKIMALNLLPPQHTSPIPHPTEFVSGFEVMLPSGGNVILPPESVLWIRNPHPLDPYLSWTPLESLGVTVEIENLAKMYNRSFLQNDGRPGILLVNRGEVNVDDRRELEARFRGGPAFAGKATVIGSEGGIDVIDMSASPRDASYIEMRNLTKEEILSAFGVGEPVLGNSSGRTFTNASEELRVFWLETMTPHLFMIARGLDELDDVNYVDFNTSKVPIMILVKQERDRYMMDENSAGLISTNEYRLATGRKKVDSDLANQLLKDPNLTPIADTEKRFIPEPAEAPTTAPLQPTSGVPEPQQAPEAPGPAPDVTASVPMTDIQSKDAWDAQAEQATNRWESLLDMSLTRMFSQQEADVVEKLGNKSLNANQVFDVNAWDRKMDEDVRPILLGAMIEAADLTSKQLGYATPVIDVQSEIDAQMERLKKTNDTTKQEIAALLITVAASDNEEDRDALVKTAAIAIFLALKGHRKKSIVAHESQTSWNAGVFVAGNQLNAEMGKGGVGPKDVAGLSAMMNSLSVPIRA